MEISEGPVRVRIVSLEWELRQTNPDYIPVFPVQLLDLFVKVPIFQSQGCDIEVRESSLERARKDIESMERSSVNEDAAYDAGREGRAMFQGDCECLPVRVISILGAPCNQKGRSCQCPKPSGDDFACVNIPFSTTKECNMEKDAK